MLWKDRKIEPIQFFDYFDAFDLKQDVVLVFIFISLDKFFLLIAIVLNLRNLIMILFVESV